MTTCEHVRLTGTLEVALPPEQAFHLFTARGEAAWVEGWNPAFPAGTVDDSEPGTVFTTHHGEHGTFWSVTGRQGRESIAYSITSPGERAGLIIVGLEPSAAGTTVTVTHDLTALVPAAGPALRQFAAGYDQMLRQWETSIARGLGVAAPA